MTTCWVCGRPINDPPRVIGHYRVNETRVAHRHCLQVLGEFELDLKRAEDAGRDSQGSRSA